MKKIKSRQRVMSAVAPYIRCGQFTITECGNGKLWIQKRGGEGMETSEAMFAAVIARFFRKEF